MTGTQLFGVVGLVVGGVTILASVIGLVVLGLDDAAADAVTAIAGIGGAVAGGFAGWMLRGSLGQDPPDAADTR
ncbi:MAG: hypothetical protein LW627_12025 [Ilumatobacteraceae bacterium]|nr:hypothetical protein [Ilumatobacteraceae bacterium]